MNHLFIMNDCVLSFKVLGSHNQPLINEPLLYLDVNLKDSEISWCITLLHANIFKLFFFNLE